MIRNIFLALVVISSGNVCSAYEWNWNPFGSEAGVYAWEGATLYAYQKDYHRDQDVNRATATSIQLNESDECQETTTDYTDVRWTDYGKVLRKSEVQVSISQCTPSRIARAFVEANGECTFTQEEVVPEASQKNGRTTVTHQHKRILNESCLCYEEQTDSESESSGVYYASSGGGYAGTPPRVHKKTVKRTVCKAMDWLRLLTPEAKIMDEVTRAQQVDPNDF